MTIDDHLLMLLPWVWVGTVGVTSASVGQTRDGHYLLARDVGVGGTVGWPTWPHLETRDGSVRDVTDDTGGHVRIEPYDPALWRLGRSEPEYVELKDTIPGKTKAIRDRRRQIAHLVNAEHLSRQEIGEREGLPDETVKNDLGILRQCGAVPR